VPAEHCGLDLELGIGLNLAEPRRRSVEGGVGEFETGESGERLGRDVSTASAITR